MHCIWMFKNINYKLSAVQKYFYRAHMQDFSQLHIIKMLYCWFGNMDRWVNAAFMAFTEISVS